MKRIIKLDDFIKHVTFGGVQKHMDYTLAQSQLPKPEVYDGGWYGDHELYYGDILVEFIDNRHSGRNDQFLSHPVPVRI